MKATKIFVVRDPSSVNLEFLKGQPKELVGKLTEEEWDCVIGEVNKAIRDKVTPLGILKNILILPFLFSHQDDSIKEIDGVIEKVNRQFKDRGVYFCNPKNLQFQEFEIIMTK